MDRLGRRIVTPLRQLRERAWVWLRRLRSRPTYVEDRREDYRRMWEAAARTVGAEFSVLSQDIWEVRDRSRRARVCNHVVPLDDPVTLRVAGDKALCYRLAGAHGIPTPEATTWRIWEVGAAKDHVLKNPGIYVVKPARRTSGARGVTTHVRTPSEVGRASTLALLYSDEFILERWIAGESYRLLFLDGKCIHVVRRTGTRVTGDGRSSVAELMNRIGVSAPGHDVDAAATLAAQGLTLEEVVGDSRSILVRSLPARVTVRPELPTIYDNKVGEMIDGPIASELVPLVQEVGSRFAGVDLITLDSGLPLREGGGAFIEINTTPGLHHHWIAAGADGSILAAIVLDRVLAGPRMP